MCACNDVGQHNLSPVMHATKATTHMAYPFFCCHSPLGPPVLPTLNEHCSANTALFYALHFGIEISFYKVSNESKFVENDEGTSTKRAVEDS